MTHLVIPGAQTLTDERIHVPRQMLEDIRTHANEVGYNEACGMIGGQKDGTQWRATLMARCGNASPNPRHHFRIQPWDQFKIQSHFSDRGFDFVGLYHSHVRAPARPSLTDTTMIPRDLVSLIYSVATREVTAWRGEDQVSIEVWGS